MATRKEKVMVLKQVKPNDENCCVPLCSANGRYNGLLSFHSFPMDAELRRRWLASIRRQTLNITQHSKVCSLHFTPDQMIPPKTAGGEKMLSKGAVPVLFQWNNYRPERPDDERRLGYRPAVGRDGSKPEPAFLDMAAIENCKLKKEIEEIKAKINELKMQSTFGLQRFAGSDEDIQFYTGFASYRHFMIFWRLIEPSVHKVIHSPRTGGSWQNEAVTAVRDMRCSLEPIDELFLFQMYLTVGLEDRDLADRFNIHPSTVNQIILSWTSFLYSLLGSWRIWMDAKDIQAHLPDDFKDFNDTQVIVDCLEFKCRTPTSPLLQREMFFIYKSHCTMKGLVGMAPHGAVTFVSSLYEGSISDKELFMRSGLTGLLREDMAIMLGKGFTVPHCVTCKVYRLPTLSNIGQVTTQNVHGGQKIERLQVHVESLFRRLTENRLFESVVPLSLVGSINELFTVACLLVNYQK